jgi:hypothetical protein
LIYTGVASPPPVTDEAKPKGVPVTTEEIARGELAGAGADATRRPKATKVAASSKDFMAE